MGLATALQLKETHAALDIDLYTGRPLHETTSYGSGGLWMPYQIAGTPDELVNDWGRRTFQHLAALHRSSNARHAGVQLLTKYNLTKEFREPPSWHDIVYRFEQVDRTTLERMGLEAFQSGWAFDTFVADQTFYLSWLQGCIDALGAVNVVKGTVKALEDLPPYSVIFNCTGLGSRELLDDGACIPIRGQVTRVKAPWIKHSYTFHDTHYIIPNVDTVVVGGTQQRGNESEQVDPSDTEAIFKTCLEYMPCLKGAEVVRHWAGLRPGRPGVRLEREMRQLQGGETLVVHNYGHGGSGITLHWGCVQDAISLAHAELGLRV